MSRFKLGKAINVACAMKEKNQGELAKFIMRSETTVSKYCNGKQKAAYDTVDLIAEFFGMSMSEFVKLGE